MRYGKIVKGEFVSRPNRFIARCVIDGEEQTCHVKNTGRCKELLVPGATVILEDCRENTARKTSFDLIAVYKGDMLVNMDSQAPNKAAVELLSKLYPSARIKAEKTYGASRIDFFVENGDERIFVEVKGVTLEDGGAVRFPDAPTDRGTKHINELVSSLAEGYSAVVLFIVQMKGVTYFEPNEKTDPKFAEALRRASSKGVKILAYDCIVTEDSMTADMPVEVRL